MACEADYQRRRLGSLPRLIGALAATLLFAVGVVWIYNAARFHMLPWIVFAAATLIFAVPLAGARLYEKLRRIRFLAERLPNVGSDASPQLEARGPFR